MFSFEQFKVLLWLSEILKIFSNTVLKINKKKKKHGGLFKPTKIDSQRVRKSITSIYLNLLLS